MSKKKSTSRNKELPKTEETAKTPPMQIPTPMPSSMVNTITLSADMNTIYLIESGRVIPYSLYSIGGVLIGLVGGQLTVVSALDPQPDPGKAPIEVTSRSASIPVVKSLKVSVDRSQWTILFLPKVSRISIIGATDIDASFTGEAAGPNLEGYLFDLREGYVNLRRSGDSLIAISVPMKA